MYPLVLIYWLDKDQLIAKIPCPYNQTFTSDVNKIFGASWLTINNDRKLPDFSSLLDSQWDGSLSFLSDEYSTKLQVHDNNYTLIAGGKDKYFRATDIKVIGLY